MPRLSLLTTLVLVQAGIVSSMWKFDAPEVVQEGKRLVLLCENDESTHAQIKIFASIFKKIDESRNDVEPIDLRAEWKKSPNETSELDTLNLRGRVDVTEGAGQLVVYISRATCSDARVYRCDSFVKKNKGPTLLKTTLEGYRDVSVQLKNGTMCRPVSYFKDSVAGGVTWDQMYVRVKRSRTGNRQDVECVTPPSGDVVSVVIYKETVGEDESKRRQELGAWTGDGGGGGSEVNWVTLDVAGVDGLCHEGVSYICDVAVRLLSGVIDTKRKTNTCEL